MRAVNLEKLLPGDIPRGEKDALARTSALGQPLRDALTGPTLSPRTSSR